MEAIAAAVQVKVDQPLRKAARHDPTHAQALALLVPVVPVVVPVVVLELSLVVVPVEAVPGAQVGDAGAPGLAQRASPVIQTEGETEQAP